MKRLLQWLGFLYDKKPLPPPTPEQYYASLGRYAHEQLHPKKKRAANNGIYFGGADASRPTWGDDDPLMSDLLVTNDDDAFNGPKRNMTFIDEIGMVPTFENYGGISQDSDDSFQGFGGGDTDGGGAGGSWDDSGSSSDSSSGE